MRADTALSVPGASWWYQRGVCTQPGPPQVTCTEHARSMGVGVGMRATLYVSKEPRETNIDSQFTFL